MSVTAVLRALHPQRREIKTVLEAKPPVRGEFPSPVERDAYLVDLARYKADLTAKRVSFNQLYVKLLDINCQKAEDQTAVDDFAETDSQLLIEVDTVLSELTVVIETLSRLRDEERQVAAHPAPQAQDNESFHSTVEATVAVKLPKIELKKFSGNIIQWQEFWDSFDSAVHKNESLSPVDKFNYLRGQLTGEAKSAIAGLALTNDNYDLAVQILRDRFGDKQLIINKHYASLAALQPPPDQTSKIRAVVDTMEKHLRSLEALGEDTDHNQFISMIISKLPRDFIFRPEENRGDGPWTVANLRKRIQTLLAAHELADQHLQSTQPTKPRQFNENGRAGHHRSTAETLFTSSSAGGLPTTPKCHFCQQQHWSDECRTYATLDARKQQVRGRCYLCLRKNHMMRDCQVERACVHCKKQKRHHRSLCPTLFQPGRRVEASNTVREVDGSGNESATLQSQAPSENVLLSSEEHGILQTALVTVASSERNPRQEVVRVLLDSGSQRSYVSVALVKKLRSRPISTETLSIYTFGAMQPQKLEAPIVKLRVKCMDGSFFEFFANVVPKVNNCPLAPVDVSIFGPAYRTLLLADSLNLTPEQRNPELLIGTDYYWDIVTAQRIGLAKGLYLIASRFGWIISGRIESSKIDSVQRQSLSMLTAVKTRHLTSLPFTTADAALAKNVDLSDWWNLESIGIRDCPYENDDEKALAKFNESVKYENGRYYVTWPWKEDTEALPANYTLSLGRLNSLLRRFKDNPDLLQKYSEIIQTQLEKGIIERVDSVSDPETRKHYIPHHAVVTPEKSTTKVRIVYDGSARARKENPSINECLYRGPVILDEVCHLLLRFRFNKVALIADIEKAFLQIGLQPHERDVTRFLWLKNPRLLTTEDNLQIYRFARVPFGIISSPFLLGATITYHLSKADSAVAHQILKDIYVDNLITGVPSPEDGIRFYLETKRLFQSASMNI